MLINEKYLEIRIVKRGNEMVRKMQHLEMRFNPLFLFLFFLKKKKEKKRFHEVN